MKMIPAIDLMDGKCVRLLKGDFNNSKQFSNNPSLQAKLWEEKGATSIHIVDLDAARSGKISNDKSIIEIRESTNLPLQLGGGIRSEERIKQLFSYGIDKIIMGTSAIENKKLVEEITSKFPDKIIFTPQTYLWLDEFVDCPYFVDKKKIIVTMEKMALQLMMFAGDVTKYGLARAMSKMDEQKSQ